MRGKVVVSAFVFSVAVVSTVGVGPSVLTMASSEAQAKRGSGAASGGQIQRSSGEAVGASVAHPGELRLMRDDYTYDGTYGYTLWHEETDDPHDHGGQPAIRVARDPGMKPSRIQQEVRQTISDYPDLQLSRERVQVGKDGMTGTAVGPIPGGTPYTEVYVPAKGEVYRIDVYGGDLDEERRELLSGIRLYEPGRSIASLNLPRANSADTLYPRGGPTSETLQRAEIPGALADEPVSPSTTSPSSRSTYSSSAVPTYGERRINEGCWLAASRFWLQTQHDAGANAGPRDGIPTGFTILGRPNYWGQFTHGNLDGYGRCKSDFYTNDKFAVDYPLNRGDRVYSPFDGGKVVFAGQTRSHRGLGTFVVIRDDNGKYVSSSGHLNGLAPGIKRGVRVGKNTVIGYAGNSGSGGVPVGEVHNHQAFYRYPSFTPSGAPYGGTSLQTLYYHYAGTAAGNRGGVYKFGWQSAPGQKAEGSRISN